MAGKQNRKNAKSKQQRIKGPGGPIPSIYHSTFKYKQFLTITAVASTVGSYAFRLNGLFDPDFTGTGAQPMYFDQFSLLYSKYRVLRTSWVVTACNEGTGANIMAVCPSMSTVIDPNMTANTMQLRAKTAVLAQATGAGCNKTIRSGVSIADLWGTTKQGVMLEDDFAALVTGNPNNVGLLWISTQGIGATATSVKISVELTFDVMFHMPKISATS